jgi:hypothetical protein
MQPMHLVTDPLSASAALLLLPGSHTLQQQHHQQFQAQQYQQQLLQTPPQSHVPIMTAATGAPNSAARQYSEREKQIKRRTKTGGFLSVSANF